MNVMGVGHFITSLPTALSSVQCRLRESCRASALPSGYASVMNHQMTAILPEPAEDIGGHLKRVFGYDSFRPGQEEIVSAVMAGRDVLAIMPTGGGKSLCYQLPAIARDGLTLVISPLIALMRDQVAALRNAGVEAGALTSSHSPEEAEAVYQALDDRRLKLLYLAPERLQVSMPMLQRAGVTFLAVDEAHCVSQWGHDFRPDYLKIGALRAALGNVQTAAFTATADAETREEIVARLFSGGRPEVFLRGFDRPNLFLAFEPKNRPRDQLLNFVKARRGQSGIVYALSRSKTEVLAKALTDIGIEALPYHAGLEPEVRSLHQDRFQREDGLVICGTIAFGMGIDKPDVRYVVHADLPKSVEAYYQEIGRAGRDGEPAETLTLYGVDDIKMRRLQIDESMADETRKRADHQRLNALLALAEAPVCRRQTLLRYFDEVLAEPCGACDLCRNPPPRFDGTVAVQKALSAIRRTGERFGSSHVIAVLLGKSNERAKELAHDQLSVFGIGQDHSEHEWQGIFRQMLALDLSRVDAHGGWSLTEAGWQVMRGERQVELRLDTVRRKAESATPKAESLIAPEDEPLYGRLKGLRRRLAEEQKVPAYVIFADRSLIDMATRKPETLDQLAECHGVGAKKLERYGQLFLEAINGAPQMPEKPARIRLAAGGHGGLYEALLEAQHELQYGTNGADKPLSCTQSTLAKIAERRPASLQELARISGMDERRMERFGERFISLIGELALSE
jgi:ATP-dependent DNA helicase RecQ